MPTFRTLLAFVVVLAAGVLVGSAITQWAPSDREAEPAAPSRDFGERIRVEVLNAGGRPDMARRAVDILRAAGFDVVDYGNAESFGQETSRVLDRVGRLDAARAVADALGIETVESETDRNLYLDVTVRLGLDWEPAIASDSASGAEPARWWNPAPLLERLGR